MRQNQTFTLPEGGTISTDNYTVSSNPSSGTSILTANHNGRKLTKMIRANPVPPGNLTFGVSEKEIEDDEMFEGMTTDDEMMAGSMEPNEDYLVNPITRDETAARAVLGVPWRALRLVRGSERGGILLRPFVRTLERLGIRAADFRDSHLITLVPAPTWREYIDNMTMTDVGAELNATVSEEDRAIIHHFLFNWENDRDHTELLRRVIRGGTEADVLQKGSLVYNLMTDAMTTHQNLDVATTSFNRMYKLARDIISSMRIKSYNYYELPLVHRDESYAIYTSLSSRYRPPLPEEAAVVEEIRRMTQANGRNYAFRTTNNNHDPVGAYELMLQTVAAYDAGDILSVRTNLDVLMKPPHNYKPETGYVGLFDPTNDSYIGNQPLIAIFKDNKNSPESQHIMMYHPSLRAALKKDNKIDMKKLDDGVYTEVVSLSNAKPIARWMKKDKNWTKITEDEYQAMIRTTDSDNYSRQERRGEQRILDERRTDRGGRGQGRNTRGGGPGRGRGGGGRRGPRRPGPPPADSDDVRSPRPPQQNPGTKKNFLFGSSKLELPPPLKQGVTGYYPENEKQGLVISLLAAVGSIPASKMKKKYSSLAEIAGHLMDKDLFITHTYSKKFGKKNQAVGEALVDAGVKLIGGVFTHPVTVVKKGTAMTGKEIGAAIKKGIAFCKKVLPKNNPDVSKLTLTKGDAKSFKGVKINPGYGGQVPLGRGKFLYVQVFPKTQLEFPKKKNLTDEERKLGKTKGETLLGLTKLVPPSSSYGGVFVHTAKHKKSGADVPWLIRLPVTHFKAVNRMRNGKNIRTIGVMKGSQKMKDAFANFEETYGLPIFNGTKSIPTRFVTRGKGKVHRANERKIANKRGKVA